MTDQQTPTTEPMSLADLPMFTDPTDDTGSPQAGTFDARQAVQQVMRRPVTHATAPGPAPAPPTEEVPAARVGEQDDEFWREVDVLALAITPLMANDERFERLGERETLELGRTYIDRALREQRQQMTASGQPPWTDAFEARIRAALESKLFGLGRIQALVDDPDVENIEIVGFDQVTLVMADGRRVQAAPVATSDEELIQDISFIAARRSHSERAFNPSSPFLSLALPGGHRLQAAAWIAPRPRVTIRRHRLVDISLDDLVGLGELDTTLRDFLAAAVRDHRSIVVSGAGQGSGKTTLVRALANAMDPDESIATIETEYELFLHEMPSRHHIVTALEARPGSGELGVNGRPAGEITVAELVYQSLRFNASRVIVGEVRGKEVLGMFQAMQMGNGSLSTIHADSAQDVIERLVTCAVEEATTSEAFAYRLVGQHVDLVVYIDNDTEENGRKHRYVSEVIEVGLGEGDRKVSVTQVFTPGRDGRAVPATPPSFFEDLVAAGLDRSAFVAGRSTWTEARDL